MELRGTDAEFEALGVALNDDILRNEYRAQYDHYKPALVPRILGGFLVSMGDLVYGVEPTYLKFRAVEVIARVPYHSWAAAAFTLLTLWYRDEARAIKLLTVKHYALFASDNETMHVVVVSQLARKEGDADFIRYTLIPVLFAFFYFWMSYFLYLAKPRWSLELNFLFEQHAFHSYERFLERDGELLKQKPITSEFLAWYGRNPRSQYEFFRSVRNDELIHRNRSIHEIAINEAVHVHSDVQ